MQNCTVSLVALLFLDLRFIWHWNKDFIFTLLGIVNILGSAADEGLGVPLGHVVFNLTDCNNLFFLEKHKVFCFVAFVTINQFFNN